MLISDGYKEQNKKLHEDSGYGKSSGKWAEQIGRIASSHGTLSILDYGCGKGLLKQALGGIVVEYDPAIEGKDSTPQPADMVVCTDVLEHIEPELLDAVLDDLQRCTKSVGFFTVSTRPAKRILDDGRNAHLIQESHAWWLPKITQRWTLRTFQNFGTEFLVLVEAKNAA